MYSLYIYRSFILLRALFLYLAFFIFIINSQLMFIIFILTIPSYLLCIFSYLYHFFLSSLYYFYIFHFHLSYVYSFYIFIIPSYFLCNIFIFTLRSYHMCIPFILTNPSKLMPVCMHWTGILISASTFLLEQVTYCITKRRKIKRDLPAMSKGAEGDSSAVNKGANQTGK